MAKLPVEEMRDAASNVSQIQRFGSAVIEQQTNAGTGYHDPKLGELLRLDPKDVKQRDLRKYVSKLMAVVEMPELAVMDKEKVKGLWAKRPDDWPENLEFRDPNNGHNNYKARGFPKEYLKKKPQKAELRQYWTHLRDKFFRLELQIPTRAVAESGVGVQPVNDQCSQEGLALKNGSATVKQLLNAKRRGVQIAEPGSPNIPNFEKMVLEEQNVPTPIQEIVQDDLLVVDWGSCELQEIPGVMDEIPIQYQDTVESEIIPPSLTSPALTTKRISTDTEEAPVVNKRQCLSYSETCIRLLKKIGNKLETSSDTFSGEMEEKFTELKNSFLQIINFNLPEKTLKKAALKVDHLLTEIEVLDGDIELQDIMTCKAQIEEITNISTPTSPVWQVDLPIAPSCQVFRAETTSIPNVESALFHEGSLFGPPKKEDKAGDCYTPVSATPEVPLSTNISSNVYGTLRDLGADVSGDVNMGEVTDPTVWRNVAIRPGLVKTAQDGFTTMPGPSSTIVQPADNSANFGFDMPYRATAMNASNNLLQEVVARSGITESDGALSTPELPCVDPNQVMGVTSESSRIQMFQQLVGSPTRDIEPQSDVTLINDDDLSVLLANYSDNSYSNVT